ncbi:MULTISPECIES: helix-turn-helix domain-containing protein [unclassified Clostridium]|uniref:helix-turn-helix domain-containing protein n=1 Tax=unclassified Clostridium TaxID=2614128 RepID=UPI003F93735A
MVLSKDELGKLIKNARKIKSEKIGRRYTQIMLAKDINKSQGYIGDIESGRTYPTFKVLSSIAEACEVPFSFFEKPKDEIIMNDTDLRENLIVHKEIDTGLNEAYNEVACTTVDKTPNEIVDIKDAMDMILSQPGLMLNGEILSDDSKIALANAINLGLQYAEQMQKKEK